MQDTLIQVIFQIIREAVRARGNEKIALQIFSTNCYLRNENHTSGYEKLRPINFPSRIYF